MQYGHAAIYLLLLHYMKCRSVYVIATHTKCRHVVVYMLVLYYINCVVIYALPHCMSRGILLFICYCYTMYSVNMLPFMLLLQCGNSPLQIFLKSYQDDQWEEYAADPSSSTSFRMEDLNWHQFLCECSRNLFMPLELLRVPQCIQYIILFVFNSPSLRYVKHNKEITLYTQSSKKYVSLSVPKNLV